MSNERPVIELRLVSSDGGTKSEAVTTEAPELEGVIAIRIPVDSIPTFDSVELTTADRTTETLTLPSNMSDARPSDVTGTFDPNPDEPRALVGWQGWDPSLLYLIRYTPDDGGEWFPVALGRFNDPSAVVDLAGLPLTGRCRFEVSAGNGTPPAQSDTLTLPYPPLQPRVQITNPPVGEGIVHTVAQNQALLLTGQVIDADRPDDLLMWVADRGEQDMQVLGHGTELVLAEGVLAVGEHRITLMTEEFASDPLVLNVTDPIAPVG